MHFNHALVSCRVIASGSNRCFDNMGESQQSCTYTNTIYIYSSKEVYGFVVCLCSILERIQKHPRAKGEEMLFSCSSWIKLC